MWEWVFEIEDHEFVIYFCIWAVSVSGLDRFCASWVYMVLFEKKWSGNGQFDMVNPNKGFDK